MRLDVVFEEVGVSAEKVFTDARALATCVTQGGTLLPINFGVNFGFVFRFRVKKVGCGGVLIIRV